MSVDLTEKFTREFAQCVEGLDAVLSQFEALRTDCIGDCPSLYTKDVVRVFVRVGMMADFIRGENKVWQSRARMLDDIPL